MQGKESRDLESIVKDTIVSQDLFSPGDRVILGVSGGADSVALCDILYRLRDALGIALIVAHVDHMLRGEDAVQDAVFVERLCAERRIPYECQRVDVSARARAEGISFEMAGRLERYAFFEALLRRYEAQKIATAHTRDDVVETFFINLLRGSGVDGLAAMPYKNGAGAVKPLLNAWRLDVEAYCERMALAYREDASNDDLVYVRNRIRKGLVPYLESEFSPAARARVLAAAQVLREEREYWERMAPECFNRVGTHDAEGGRIYIDREKLAQRPTAEQKHVLRYAIRRLRGSLKDIGAKDIEAVLALDKTGTIREIVDCVAQFSYGQLILIHAPRAQGLMEVQVPPDPPRLYTLEIPVDALRHYTLDETCVGIDADSVRGPIRVRYRAPGDRWIPLGMTGHKKLKDFFIDEKVPEPLRGTIPLVCDDEKILWVKDMRLDDRCKRTSTTEKIILMSFNELVESP